MRKLKSVSVFFPAYNEEENIAKTVKDAFQVLKKIADRFELIVVDDGSTDHTATIVKQLQKKIPQLKLIRHKKNRGYGGAVKTGLSRASYPWIVYTDSDGQFDFAEIKNFLPLASSADLILGYRIKRTDSLYRRFLQKILWLADLILFGLNVKDVDCGFKMIKKEVVKTIWPLTTESAITETELVVRAKRAGFKIAQVGVHHHARLEGEQTGGKLKIIAKAAWEGIKLWWQLIVERFKPR